MYLWTIIKGLSLSVIRRESQSQNKNMILFFVGVLVMQMILHVGFVAYSDLPSLLFLLLTFKLIVTEVREKAEEKYLYRDC